MSSESLEHEASETPKAGEFPPELRMDPAWVPATRLAQLARSIVFTLVILAAWGAFRRIVAWPEIVMAGTTVLVAAAILLRVLSAIFWPGLSRKYCRYEVLSDRIVVHRGVLMRSITTLPRSRIQHIELAQGPLARRYDIADLHLNTAGTVNARVTLIGLPVVVARALRDRLVEDTSDGGV